MKNSLKVIALTLAIFCTVSCDKENGDPTPSQPVLYSSTDQFLASNAGALQSFVIDAVAGGSFTTPQGTPVIVPANAFISQSGNPVVGSVLIKFKDVYKKSDMLFNKLSTNMLMGGPIKSAGMFYIKATQGSETVLMAAGKKIDVNQPLNGLVLDTGMVALVLAADTIGGGWVPPFGNPSNELGWTASSYVYSFYQFSTPQDSGSWCNSDNPGFFSGSQNTILTLNPLDNSNSFNTDVYLIFNDVNAMVHVYKQGTAFKYNFAPLGSQCTMVAIGVKDGKLYSSFRPINITGNLTMDFALSETTMDAFKTQLNALNE